MLHFDHGTNNVEEKFAIRKLRQKRRFAKNVSFALTWSFGACKNLVDFLDTTFFVEPFGLSPRGQVSWNCKLKVEFLHFSLRKILPISHQQCWNALNFPLIPWNATFVLVSKCKRATALLVWINQLLEWPTETSFQHSFWLFCGKGRKASMNWISSVLATVVEPEERRRPFYLAVHASLSRCVSHKNAQSNLLCGDHWTWIWNWRTLVESTTTTTATQLINCGNQETWTFLFVEQGGFQEDGSCFSVSCDAV